MAVLRNDEIKVPSLNGEMGSKFTRCLLTQMLGIMPSFLHEHIVSNECNSLPTYSLRPDVEVSAGFSPTEVSAGFSPTRASLDRKGTSFLIELISRVSKLVRNYRLTGQQLPVLSVILLNSIRSKLGALFP